MRFLWGTSPILGAKSRLSWVFSWGSMRAQTFHELQRSSQILRLKRTIFIKQLDPCHKAVQRLTPTRTNNLPPNQSTTFREKDKHPLLMSDFAISYYFFFLLRQLFPSKVLTSGPLESQSVGRPSAKRAQGSWMASGAPLEPQGQTPLPTCPDETPTPSCAWMEVCESADI